MATALSNDTTNPAVAHGMAGTPLRRVSGVFVFPAGTTCDIPVKLTKVSAMNFTALGPETIAPTSTEATNVTGLIWNRPSTGLMNITRSAATTSGLLVFYEYWGQ